MTFLLLHNLKKKKISLVPFDVKIAIQLIFIHIFKNPYEDNLH